MFFSTFASFSFIVYTQIQCTERKTTVGIIDLTFIVFLTIIFFLCLSHSVLCNLYNSLILERVLLCRWYSCSSMPLWSLFGGQRRLRFIRVTEVYQLSSSRALLYCPAEFKFSLWMQWCFRLSTFMAVYWTFRKKYGKCEWDKRRYRGNLILCREGEREEEDSGVDGTTKTGSVRRKARNWWTLRDITCIMKVNTLLYWWQGQRTDRQVSLYLHSWVSF